MMQIAQPDRRWSDGIVRWLRTNAMLRGLYHWITARLIPFLFALFIAAPIGLLILPFFIPKFIRNARRRRRYGVKLAKTPMDRITPERPVGRASPDHPIGI
jgi:hypothetical protein